jgi:hypothetical protein
MEFPLLVGTRQLLEAVECYVSAVLARSFDLQLPQVGEDEHPRMGENGVIHNYLLGAVRLPVLLTHLLGGVVYPEGSLPNALAHLVLDARVDGCVLVEAAVDGGDLKPWQEGIV